LASAEWHGSGGVFHDGEQWVKASFYVTNFPDNLPLIRLRQSFEVREILTDIYVARHRNARGQEFGFVRFVNVKNKVKLSQALNNVWIDQCRIWAREARFDRFAHNDVAIRQYKVVGREEEDEVRPVGRSGDEGDKKVGWGNTVSGEKKGKEVTVNVGSVEVKVLGEGGKRKVRRVEEGVSGAAAGVVVGKKPVASQGVMKADAGGNIFETRDEGKPMSWQVQIKPKQHQQINTLMQFIPTFKSRPDDRNWAKSEMVATVLGGDSSLALQQRVDDAGFNHVYVTPMGGDRVFLYCSDDNDVWQVFHNALDFFGMLFGNLHRWSTSNIKHERGAWVRLYGAPIHAWSADFFRLCVSNSGRFIRADDCTVDKARLDYAQILISTPSIEIVNTSSDFFIDGCKYVIKLVEEWGCCLGEDAFLTDGVPVTPYFY